MAAVVLGATIIGTILGALKVEITTTLAVEANLELMLRRGTKAAYDGVVEIYTQRDRPRSSKSNAIGRLTSGSPANSVT